VAQTKEEKDFEADREQLGGSQQNEQIEESETYPKQEGAAYARPVVDESQVAVNALIQDKPQSSSKADQGLQSIAPDGVQCSPSEVLHVDGDMMPPKPTADTETVESVGQTESEAPQAISAGQTVGQGANSSMSSPPRSERQQENMQNAEYSRGGGGPHNTGDYSESYSYYPPFSGHHMHPAGITKFYVGRILTDTTEEQIRQAFQSFGDVFDVRIIKKAYNGQPLRETYYAFVLIALQKTVKEVTSHFDKNPTQKGWNVSLAKESSRNDDYHNYREASPTRKRRGEFGSPGQSVPNDPNGFLQTSPNMQQVNFGFPSRGGRGMSSAERNMNVAPGINKFYRDRWNDGRPDQYSRDNWDPNNSRP
jgi:RNA recognition motif. (a.k.a. RRM, RBD, or RNP domain)